jgi:hypothetical protein
VRNSCAQVLLSEKYKTKCQKSTPTVPSNILVLTFVLWNLNRWLLTRAFWVIILYSLSVNLDFKTWKPSSSHRSSRHKTCRGSHKYWEGSKHWCLLCHERQWTFCYHPYSLLSIKNDTITQSRRSLFVCSNSVSTFVIWLTYVVFSFQSFIQNHTLIIMDDSSYCKENIVIFCSAHAPKMQALDT